MRRTQHPSSCSGGLAEFAQSLPCPSFLQSGSPYPEFIEAVALASEQNQQEPDGPWGELKLAEIWNGLFRIGKRRKIAYDLT